MYLDLNFEYAGIRSETKGLAVVRTEDGMIQFPFGTTQQPIEEKFKAIDEPFHHGVERTPKTFNLTFAILDDSIKWDNDKRTEIVRWLFQSDYKPFISDDNPDILYMIMAVSDATRFDNGLMQGYVTVSFRMMTPYAYTVNTTTEPMPIDQTNKIIELENKSNVADYIYYPILEFTLTGNTTDITFTNLTDMGRQLKFTGLDVGETVYVDNKRGEIISSTGKYRISACNRAWLRLVYGKNRIKIDTNNNGGALVTAQLQFPMNF